ncbi:MAG: flagellar biosynthesis anti-sigma factor FlgM [candidate division FCPU426 bacterium]
MDIQGIPSAYQPAPSENTSTTRIQRPAPTPAPAPAKAAETKIPTPAPVADRELESITQQMDQLRQLSQNRNAVSEINQTLSQMRQDLKSASQERLQEFFGTINGEGSAWQNLTLQEKAYEINQLKDKIRSLELERTALVQNMREQIQSGTYRVSGTEILKGMLEEYF